MKNLTPLILSAAALLLGSATAFADPTLTISDGLGNSIQIDAYTGQVTQTVSSVATVYASTALFEAANSSDSASASAVGPGDNSASFDGAIGAWGLNLDAGSTSGGPLAPTLDINLGGTAATSGTLTINWTDDTLDVQTPGVANLNLFDRFQNATMTVTANGTPLGSGISVTNPNSSNNSASGSASLPTGPITSLSETIALTGNGNTISIDGSTSVPDSGTTAMLIGLGVGAIGLGLIVKQRRTARA